ncbi:MAG: glutamate--tRNA ligase, partial [Candidatus Omnitrophica bacterium]|nr:glutamate--tRNA ligase [Candidatus Omnitrophota bacterium]
RAQQGKFIIRIEDTDKIRSKQEYVDEILESLQWLGFSWDEIYYQSQRFSIYRDYAQRLLSQGKAYLEKSPNKQEGEAVIFKVQPQIIKIEDLIRGQIQFDTTVIKDQVLIKSDGTPTYNFACVVDDALMDITHVIRGDDHISNTPKQILFYQALGFAVPKFAHLPLIMGMEGGRLSKRTGATSISEYRKMGYLSEALVNYLLLLSWSPGDNREVIDINEAIRFFDIKDVNRTSANFDLRKLNWVNNQYIRRTKPEVLLELLTPLLIEKGYVKEDNFDKDYVISLVKLFQERISTLNDFLDWADFFFLDEPKIDPQAKEKFLNKDFSKEFKLFIERLKALETFDTASIENTFREMVRELNIEAKTLIHPIRVALTGKTIGPGLFEVIHHLGKDRVIKRLMLWVKS